MKLVASCRRFEPQVIIHDPTERASSYALPEEECVLAHVQECGVNINRPESVEAMDAMASDGVVSAVLHRVKDDFAVIQNVDKHLQCLSHVTIQLRKKLRVMRQG